MITVIDYGMGNLRSVVKSVEKYTDDVKVSSDPEDIARSDGLIMPGDGAFGMAMENLRSMGWVDPLKKYIADGGYFLGICLGFQLLYSSSEEFGTHEGLGVIPGKVIKFRDSGLKIPHMGWNSVKFLQDSPFLNGIPQETYFYFIHSFHAVSDDDSWNIGVVDYGVEFPCIAGSGNLIATQFHPEKSHNSGLKIVENFVRSVC